MVGVIVYAPGITLSEIPFKKWFVGAILLGVLFIFIFNLMARTSQLLGVSVASVATKMSLTIPVLLGVLIVMALAAVYFASVKKTTGRFSKKAFYLPMLVFIGSGVIDASLQYAEQYLVSREESPLFSATIFACAAFCGICFVFFKSFKQGVKVSPNSIIGGIALGVPNYFSIYFLLGALQNNVLNSASVFTINNVAIVMLSTLLGIVLFREELSVKNWVGITLAVFSIVLVAIY
jgi:uncharacterized membrane protein